jgi:hypothetical protein
VSLIGTVGVLFLVAHKRVTAETMSGMQLGNHLATAALRNAADARNSAVAFEQLVEELPQVRHVRFELLTTRGALVPGAQAKFSRATPSPPRLFVRLLAPPPVKQSFPIVVQGQSVGTLTSCSNPTDEISEVIDEIRLLRARS